MNVRPYYNKEHTQFAVLITMAYGSGWSSWNKPELAWDSRVVEYFLKHGKTATADDWEEVLCKWGYEDVFIGSNIRNLDIEWGDCCQYWRIVEYDGAEEVEYFNKEEWNWMANY